MEQFELVVVGGGQAGANAACEAARLGVKVTLIDENPVSPAWMRLQVPLFYGTRIPENLTAQQVYRWLEQQPLLREAIELGVDVRTQHAVWGSFPERVLGIYHEDRTWLAQAERIIFATGAGDVPLAFPGWALSGVMGGAGAKALLDIYGYLPVKRMLILGSNNLAMNLALQVGKAGIEVAGIVEVGSEICGSPSLARDLAQSGVPLFLGYSIKEARGQLEVEQAVLARVDGQTGALVRGSERVVEADAICIAIGLSPSLELPFLSRCEIGYDSHLGVFSPSHDEDMQTNQPGIFVAGSVASVSDTMINSEISGQEGALAAIGVAKSLGRIDASEAERRKSEVRARLNEMGYQSSNGQRPSGNGYVERWLRVGLSNLDPDVLVCRCEEISLSKVLDGVGFVGAHHPDEVKRVTRCGMGYCQGRDCRILLASLLAQRTGRSLSSFPIGTFRAPVRPIKLSVLATEEEETEYDRKMAPAPGTAMRGLFAGPL